MLASSFEAIAPTSCEDVPRRDMLHENIPVSFPFLLELAADATDSVRYPLLPAVDSDVPLEYRKWTALDDVDCVWSIRIRRVDAASLDSSVESMTVSSSFDCYPGLPFNSLEAIRLSSRSKYGNIFQQSL